MTTITSLNKFYRYLIDKRIIDEEDHVPKRFAKHMAHYIFASNKIKNKSGLEIGCNKGYGAYYLSHFAKRIIGIDIDTSDVFLGQKVLPADNLDLLAMDAITLGFNNNSFDFVICFHAIEHIPVHQLESFVSECAKILKPGGIFYVATPNLEFNLKKPQYLKEMYRHRNLEPRYKYHSKEFMKTDLKDLLNKVFERVTIYGVRVSRKHRIYRRLKKIGLIKWYPKRFNPIVNFYNHCCEKDFIVVSKVTSLCQDLLAVCQKQ